MAALSRNINTRINLSEIDLFDCPLPQNGRMSIFWLHDVPKVLARVLGVMKHAGYGPVDRFAVGVALEEAASNALKHGHDHDPRKQVRIWWTVTAVAVRLVVEDEGRGFDPADISNPYLPENLERPGGRGLFRMFTSMTSVRFNQRGNCVVMYRQRSQGSLTH
jgi:serine/threonine-protein kinase RsbW